MIAEIANPDEITAADIVVGIPSYNEADFIATPASIVSKGLMDHFADKSLQIVNVDNHSRDGTKEAFLNTKTMVPRIYVTTSPGIRGLAK